VAHAKARRAGPNNPGLGYPRPRVLSLSATTGYSRRRRRRRPTPGTEAFAADEHPPPGIPTPFSPLAAVRNRAPKP